MRESLSDILDAIDMESWLTREGIDYKVGRGSSGVQISVKVCPFCGDDRQKCDMNAESGAGKCFVCEQKFSKWLFIKATLGFTGGDTMRHLKQVAAENGWRPPKRVEVAVSQGKLKLPKSIALPHEGRNLKYLENRNITSEIAKYFHLRYCHEGKYWYESEGRNLSQDYSKRVIIPVYDLDGDMISFQGRDVTGTAERKYLFPPGFAATGTTLYNGHNALRAKRVIAGEGVFDAIALKIVMDEMVETRDIVPIGTFGKHLSYGSEESQLHKLLQLKQGGLEEITFMWDSEAKAIAAAVDSALLCRSVGLRSRVAILPAGQDPNESTAAEVRRAFWQAKDVSPATAALLKMNAARM